MFQITQRNYIKKIIEIDVSFASIEPLTLKPFFDKVYLRCGAQTTGPF